jgi:hypothetical protein
MSWAPHAVESKAVVRIEVAVSPRRTQPTAVLAFLPPPKAERANDSIVSRLRATAIAQADENGDATDEVLALPVKSMRYIKGLLLCRVIKNLGDIQGQAAPKRAAKRQDPGAGAGHAGPGGEAHAVAAAPAPPERMPATSCSSIGVVY